MDGNENFENNLAIDFEWRQDQQKYQYDEIIKSTMSMKTISDANGLKICAL